MDGYAAYGRVDRRRVASDEETLRAREDPLPPDAMVIDAEDGASGGPSAGRRLHERLAAAREGWAITTFYLFDPNSWR
jgi:hypothetical protein